VFSPSPPPGGSKTPWTAAPELSEADSARWPGQYTAWAKEVIFLIAAVPHGQRCGPVRAYGRLAPSFPGRRIQDGLRTTATMPANGVMPFFSLLKLSGAPFFCLLPPAGTRRQGPVGRNRAAMPANRPVQDRNAPVVGEGRVRLRPTRPKRLKQLAVVKRQPPGHSREVMVETEAVMEKLYRVVVERAGM
jgi:hypothetical protein